MNAQLASWWSLQTSRGFRIAELQNDGYDDEKWSGSAMVRNLAADPGTVTQRLAITRHSHVLIWQRWLLWRTKLLGTQESHLWRTVLISGWPGLIVMTIIGTGRWPPLVTRQELRHRARHRLQYSQHDHTHLTKITWEHENRTCLATEFKFIILTCCQ